MELCPKECSRSRGIAPPSCMVHRYVGVLSFDRRWSTRTVCRVVIDGAKKWRVSDFLPCHRKPSLAAQPRCEVHVLLPISRLAHES